MPPKMKMHIPNGSPYSVRSVPTSNSTQTPVRKPTSTFNSSIIGRVHNVKPGCGGCGK